MKLKKIIGILVSAVICGMNALPVISSAKVENVGENQFTDGTIIYERIKGGVAVAGVDSGINKIIISDKASGYDVIEISEKAFEDNHSLKSVTLPDSIKTIGKYAFSGCVSLEEINLPKSLTSLPEGVFVNCQSLTEMAIPESVTVIGMGAFMNCISMTNINIPSSVISFEDYAFNNCYSIESLEIPENLENIGSLALGGLYNLKELTVDEENSSFTINDDILYDIDLKTLYLACDKSISGDITIPETVSVISDYAFSNTNITSVTIPSSVTEIGSDAFSYCQKLKEVNLSEGLESIDGYAFQYNSSIEKVNIPVTVRKIGVGAFANNESLSQIIIPEGVTSIGACAFFGCKSLTAVSLPSTIQTIGEYAFGFMPNATGSDAEAQENFSISVFSNTAGEEYARSNNLNYDIADFSLKRVVFIAVCCVVLVIIAFCGIRIMKKSSGKTADENSEEKENYQSIVDEEE